MINFISNLPLWLWFVLAFTAGCLGACTVNYLVRPPRKSNRSQNRITSNHYKHYLKRVRK